MNAKEMFENIGYELIDILPIIQYIKRNEKYDEKITFGTDKQYYKFRIFKNGDYDPSNLDEIFPYVTIMTTNFTIEELDAIYKQIKELGW